MIPGPQRHRAHCWPQSHGPQPVWHAESGIWTCCSLRDCFLQPLPPGPPPGPASCCCMWLSNQCQRCDFSLKPNFLPAQTSCEVGTPEAGSPAHGGPPSGHRSAETHPGVQCRLSRFGRCKHASLLRYNQTSLSCLPGSVCGAGVRIYVCA